MNTTPKPRATKKSSGELELLLGFVPDGEGGDALALDVAVDIV